VDKNPEPTEPAEIIEHPRILSGMAELPGKTLLDEAALATLLGVSKRTVRRMVQRFELPPSIAVGGRATWIVERVLAHLDERARRAAREADRECQRISAPIYGFRGAPKSSESKKGPADVDQK